jgi:hypothetical protein
VFESGSSEHKAYAQGCSEGAKAESDRILALLDNEMSVCECEEALKHAISRIKGEDNA